MAPLSITTLLAYLSILRFPVSTIRRSTVKSKCPWVLINLEYPCSGRGQTWSPFFSSSSLEVRHPWSSIHMMLSSFTNLSLFFFFRFCLLSLPFESGFLLQQVLVWTVLHIDYRFLRVGFDFQGSKFKQNSIPHCGCVFHPYIFKQTVSVLLNRGHGIFFWATCSKCSTAALSLRFK